MRASIPLLKKKKTIIYLTQPTLEEEATPRHKLQEKEKCGLANTRR
jgi:hypothetical protein